MELAKIIFPISAPAEKVWELFSDFGGIDKLYPREGVPPLPPITKVDVSRSGIGTIRTVHLLGGDPAVEKLTCCDPDALIVEYDALSLPIGVDEYSARIEFHSDGPERTTVVYSAKGTPTYMSEAQLRETLSLLFTAIVSGARDIAEARVGTT